MIPIMTSSSTSRPSWMAPSASLPRRVPRLCSSRRISPVEIMGTPNRSCRKSPWVLLPLPGAPNSSSFTTRPPLLTSDESYRKSMSRPPLTCIALRSSDESTVLPHDQLRLQLLHRIEGDAHDDEYGGASQVQLLLRDRRQLGRPQRQ